MAKVSSCKPHELHQELPGCSSNKGASASRSGLTSRLVEEGSDVGNRAAGGPQEARHRSRCAYLNQVSARRSPPKPKFLA